LSRSKTGVTDRSISPGPTQAPRELFSSKTGVAALSIASNLTLTLLKLFVGISTGAVSVIAEAIHSGVDLLASIIAWVAVRTSSRPPDEDHPYGHGKYENVSGTIEAVLIFLAAGLIVNEAVQKLLNQTEAPKVDLGLIVMGVSVVANFLVSRQLFVVARRTDSVALEADAYHLTTDIATSVGVFVGLIAVRLTGFTFLDPLVALFVAGLIVKAAWDITRKSFVDLVDRSLPDEDRESIIAVLNAHSDVIAGFHRVRTRKSGPERLVDLHLVVNGSSSVEEAHALCDHLERDLRGALGDCTVDIHVEPCRQACDLCEVKCRTRAATP
jgi:cation diffusion facilitator family transporter